MTLPLIRRCGWVVLIMAATGLAFAAGRAGGAGGAARRYPGAQYTLHDDTRPKPRIVTPGASFSQKAPVPSDATVLFDGKDLFKWTNSRGQPAQWKVTPKTDQDAPNADAGYFESGRGLGNIRTKDKFADFQLHLEFASPTQVEGTSQERGNSGVIFNGMYEVQVLDNFNNPTYADGTCGALYGQTPPLVNACLGPGQWQTYDIVFESPRWNESGELIKKAAVTVIQNGIVLHHRREYLGQTDGVGQTAYQSPGTYRQHPPEVNIELQDHNNPVRFRNIWVRALGEYDKP
jgi:hypothetical protein